MKTVLFIRRLSEELRNIIIKTTLTGEIFKVSKRYRRGSLSIYEIVDFNGNDLQGTFYQDILQKVTIRGDQIWKIDKKLRKKGKKIEYLVQGLHWPSSLNSRVDAKDIEDI